MISGKPFNSKDALKLGLVDQVVKAPTELLPAAIKLALLIADGKAPRKQSLTFAAKLKSQEEDLLPIASARVAAKKNKLAQVHNLALLDAVEAGVAHGSGRGLEREMELFGQVGAAAAAVQVSCLPATPCCRRCWASPRPRRWCTCSWPPKRQTKCLASQPRAPRSTRWPCWAAAPWAQVGPWAGDCGLPAAAR